MAGIGFQLRRLAEPDRPGGWAQLHLYGALVSAGPWFLSICALGILSFAGRDIVGHMVHEVFAAIISYTYSATLITTGLGSIVIARHLADVLYADDSGVVLATYRYAIGATAAIHAVLAGGVYAVTPGLAVDVRLAAAVLAVVVGCTWMAMVFAGAVEDFHGVVVAFVVGNALAVIGGLVCGARFGLSGYLGGFTLGQAVLFVALTARIERSFGTQSRATTPPLQAIRRYPELALVGALSSAGFAVDRMLFGLSREGIAVAGWLRQSLYDTPILLAYLSVVPAIAVFVVSVETDFYTEYRRYFGAVTQHGTLSQVLAAKAGIARALHQGLVRILTVQAPITLGLTAAAPALGEVLGLERLQVSLLRTLFIGALPHALAVFGIIVLLYFDRRRMALEVSAVFFATNAGVTVVSLALGPAWYGLGFAIAALVSSLLAQRHLAHAMNELEYATFSRQPVVPTTA
jgi:polysaccharide biosynthesis protein PelG